MILVSKKSNCSVLLTPVCATLLTAR